MTLVTAQPRAPIDVGTKLQLVPAAYTKTVHFIRHGQAFSNVAGEKDHAAYASEEWFDASLSPLGWQQAHALGRHIQAIKLRPELVVVSPLTRALQTACGAFGAGPVQPGSSAPPLMVALPAVEGHQVEHEAISAEGAPPFLACELCREHLGVHPCDRRRDNAHYRQHFPGIDFSLIQDETDKLWLPDERESHENIKERGAQFLAWLMSRPEREIAVVAHSSFLHFTCSNFAKHPGAPAAVVAEYVRWFENCELRSFTLADASAPHVAVCNTNFPGGLRAVAADH